jgi:hypothetical protein
VNDHRRPHDGRSADQPASTSRASIGSILVGGLIVVLVIACIGLGVFILLRQQGTSAPSARGGAQPQSGTNTPRASFSFSFSGPISGPLSVSAVNVCGQQSGTQTYEVDVNGSVNGTAYELTILIPQYHGQNTYSTAGASATAAVSLLDPGNGATLWASQGQPGSITINSGGTSGKLTATLMNAKGQKQEQVSGAWSCES